MFERYPVEEIIELMAQNAAQVAYHSFKWQYTTLILFNASCLFGLDVFVKSYDKNIKLYNVMESVPDLKSEDVNQFILFVADVSDAQAFLNVIEIQKLKANAKFIIICEHSNECDETQAVKILWTYTIFNVIFIKNEDSLISGYTYFRSERCDRPTPPRRLEHWDKCIDSSKKVIKLCKKHMFPQKFSNFHRCPLIVSTFEQHPFMYINDGVPYGADGDLLRCIVHTLNATLVLISPRDDDGWGSYENNTWTGSLGDVYNDLANVSMTSASITFNRLKYFDMSINYNTLDLVWITHPSEFESSSLKLLKPFTRKARMLFVVTLMIPLVIHILLKLRIMDKIKTRFNAGLSSDSFLIYALQISLGFSVTKYPKNFYKHVFLFWVWYWFFVRILYQVYLIHSLHTDVPLNTINTLRDAIEEGYQYGSSPAIRDYFVDDQFIYNNWVFIDTNEMFPTMIDLTKGKKFVFAINLVFVKLFRRNTRLSLRILPHKILNSPTVLFFKKHSCLTQDVNHVLTRLFEAGIPDALYENYIYRPKQKNNTQEVLFFKHFHTCFTILVFGYILSIAVFVLEKLFGADCKIFRNIYR